jgi:hypothetical protein
VQLPLLENGRAFKRSIPLIQWSSFSLCAHALFASIFKLDENLSRSLKERLLPHGLI